MGIADLIIAGIILAGAVHLLYRSLWKKKGCHGCTSDCCGKEH